jgi:hypothetical protein
MTGEFDILGLMFLLLMFLLLMLNEGLGGPIRWAYFVWRNNGVER